MNATQRKQYEKMLLELTGLPTAAGREDAVIAWVERWVARRKHITTRRDRYGNMLLSRKGARSEQPILLTAHMDHPAFVALGAQGKRVTAEFRGGVRESYFMGSKVRLWRGTQLGAVGRVVSYKAPNKTMLDDWVEIEFKAKTDAQAGDILTWDLPKPRIVKGRLYAPACDDLAGLAAGLAAFEKAIARRDAKSKRYPDVRMLLTRVEEVGMIGAAGASKRGLIPRGALLLALENSKSFAESPIGGGPIVRVGDRLSTFDNALTSAVARVAERLDMKARKRGEEFKWMRRLMPGGFCEATVYQLLGHTATCLCLALGNYHNMNEQTGRIDSEVISIDDYHGLIELLIEAGRALGTTGGLTDASDLLHQRLERLFEQRRHLLR